MEKGSSQPKNNSTTTILLTAILICFTGFAVYYFGVLKKTRLISIEISHPLPMEQGKTRQLTAIGQFSDNRSLDITNQVIWRSSDTEIAAISNMDGTRGMVNSSMAGQTTITATDQSTGIVGTTLLKVMDAELASISLLPETLTVIPGQKQQFTAMGTFSDGKKKEITSSVIWGSSASSVAFPEESMKSPGMVTSVSAGTTVITVKDPNTGVTGTASLTVSAPATSLTVLPAKLLSCEISPRYPSLALGKTQQLTVSGVYTDQSRKDLTRTSIWAVENPEIAKISNDPDQQGVITALAVGSTNIRVKNTETGISATTTLIVTAAEMVTLAISPRHAVIPLGQNKQLSVTGTLSDGSKIDLTQDVNWSSSNLSAAIVGNTPGQKGNVFSRAAGISLITIKDPISGIQETSKISVTSKELVSIRIETEPQIPLGTTLKLTAKGFYSDGSENEITESGDWSSGTPSVIAVMNQSGSKGRITTISLGESSITFTDTLSKTSKTIELSVTTPRLKAISIDPKTRSIYLGELQQFKAIGEYTDGTKKDITESIEWESSEPILSSIRNNQGRKGLATAHTVGSSIITATDISTKITGKAKITGREKW
jgi:trimeric autotransporter adhesin